MPVPVYNSWDIGGGGRAGQETPLPVNVLGISPPQNLYGKTHAFLGGRTPRRVVPNLGIRDL